MKVLFDTNVIIDFINNRSEAKYAEEVLLMSFMSKIDGYITPKSVIDIRYIIKQYVNNEELTRFIIKNTISSLTIVDILSDDIYAAFESNMNDFEDAVLVNNAERYDIDYIITNNLKDFVGSPIKALSPKQFLDIYN